MASDEKEHGMDRDIRRIVPEDLADVIVNENAAHITPWSEKLIVESIQASINNKQQAWLLSYCNKPVGHMVVLPIEDQWELLNIVVHPDFQGKGLGGYCLNHLFQQARNQSVHSIYLEVRQSNSLAINLYSRFGFIGIGVRKNYYRKTQGWEDARVMQAFVNSI